MDNHKRVPSIRFKGFADDWEQRGFSDITFSAGEKNKYNLPYESYSITNEDGFIPQDEKFENGGTMREADKKMYYIVPPNTFAYNPARINVGSIGYQNLTKSVIVSSLYEVFKTTEKVDDHFLWHWFKSNDFQKLILQLQEGGVRLYFYYDKLCMGKIDLPTIEEQKRIGTCLDKLDNLITLHQQKYDKLLNVKKAMLEKMFPKDGETVPEFRFKGFTGDWKQHKLGDITSSYSGGTPAITKSEYYGGHIPFIRSGEIDEEKTELFITEDGMKNSSASMVNKGDILYALYGATSGEVSRAKLNGAINQAILAIIPNDGYDAECLMQWLRRQKKRVVDTYLQGGQGNLSATIVKELLVKLPNHSEQIMIGVYLKNLDNLITIQQCKIEKLKNFKKAMLERMFV